jgi:hypothetical protein
MPSTPCDLSAFPDGTPLAEIAAALGATIGDVRRGIPRGRVRATAPRHLDPALEVEVVRRYLAMQGMDKIAAELPVGGQTVHAALVRSGVARRRPGFPRRVHVDDVVAFYEQGLTRAQIAAEFGCSEVTVRTRLHEAGTLLTKSRRRRRDH